MQSLNIVVCDSPAEAPNYNHKGYDFETADIIKAVVVGQGTVSGKATVDIQFKTSKGNFVAIITGGLLKNLVAAVEGVEARTTTPKVNTESNQIPRWIDISSVEKIIRNGEVYTHSNTKGFPKRKED